MPKKILIVDDEPDILKVVQFRLSRRGYEVILATNGKEALEKIAQEKPDLVLLDVIMPVLDGLEVCKRLKEDESLKKIPVVMLTAQGTVNEEKLLSTHADGWIKKPFDPEELFQAVERFLK